MCVSLVKHSYKEVQVELGSTFCLGGGSHGERWLIKGRGPSAGPNKQLLVTVGQQWCEFNFLYL